MIRLKEISNGKEHVTTKEVWDGIVTNGKDHLFEVLENTDTAKVIDSKLSQTLEEKKKPGATRKAK
jgi:hypothetical protein